ncbi:MAG TPA: serine hydrolase [Candidatus Binatia bacterium]|nr:serine hydrolase [Candidatus Binatia bacterium]
MVRTTIAPLACGLLVTLALTVHVPDATAQLSARSAGASPTSVASRQAASASQTRVPARPRRHRRLRRQATFSLPAVTAAGIPRLHAKAAYVLDATSNRVLFEKNPDNLYPVASLTKLMTALVYFQTQPQFDQVVEIMPDDVKHSSRSHIRPHEEITVRDLLHAALMSSDNVATKALVRSSGIPLDEFVARMNALADSMNLTGTHFVEPTGLDERNVASAQAIAALLRTAASNPIVSSIMQKQTYSFASNRKLHRLVSTNRLLKSKWRITGGKTGFINEAGYCFATMVETPSGTEVTAVLLGAPSNRLRFAEARRLLDWTFRFGLPRAAAAAGTE